jgi:hypothetical protein
MASPYGNSTSTTNMAFQAGPTIHINAPMNRVNIQLNGQEITQEVVSDPETRKQRVQLVIRAGQTVTTIESPVEIENMRNLAKTLLDWANAIEQSEATNTLTGNG